MELQRLLLMALGILVSLMARGQFAVGSETNAVVIKSGEIFHFDGLTLTPSSDITLSSTVLTRTDATTISPIPTGTYISRYYNFTNTTPAFSGTARFSYLGATLNGIPEANLRLNVRTNGTIWNSFADLPDMTNDFVQSVISSTTLNTITLASVSAPLPVSWLEFTGVNRNGNSVLHWVTATENNSRDFLVQHSSTAENWTTIGSVKAAGNSVEQQRYGFTHYTPRNGINYYRLLQRDMDDRVAYSKVVTLWVNRVNASLSVFPNPVTNGIIHLVLSEPMLIRLFEPSGKLIRQQWFGSGVQNWPVSGLSGGLYYLQAGGKTIELFIK